MKRALGLKEAASDGGLFASRMDRNDVFLGNADPDLSLTGLQS
jgi:hypothetical protein